MNIQELFHQTTQRNPAHRELFVHDGHIHVYHEALRRWTDLGEPTEPGAVPDVGSLQFEIQQGIIIEGSPQFVIRFMMRAFFNFGIPEAQDVSDTLYKIFRECGWRGPIESENENVAGQIILEAEGKFEVIHVVDDLRIVMAQMTDPNFNGWLQFEFDGEVQFIQTGHMRRIKVLKVPAKKRKDEDGAGKERGN